LEKRPNRAAVRRRKHCSACGHRETTYEISQKQFKEWKTIEKLGAQLREVLLGKSQKPAVAANDSGIKCPTCRHWSGKGCDFEFPEAGGKFAEECSMYDSLLRLESLR
jgi:DNA-directed RNA polymerase subunit RPC12/RpoP